jgi:hypothetical protein
MLDRFNSSIEYALSNRMSISRSRFTRSRRVRTTVFPGRRCQQNASDEFGNSGSHAQNQHAFRISVKHGSDCAGRRDNPPARTDMGGDVS